MKNLKLVAKSDNPKTIVRIGNVELGRNFTIIAGPCSIESRSQAVETAFAVKDAGAHLFRGGVYKPRTSPYSFQGLGRDGLAILEEVRRVTGLGIVTEVIDSRDVQLVSEYADMLQIGSRNMQNYSLLKEVGRSGKPILLKRGMHATLEEWLNCAEYILLEGNPNVVLCERGIRTFETYTRNTLDLNAVPALRDLTHLPVITDPSHGTGLARLISPMTLASLACGADGVMIEVHRNPPEALSDKDQTLNPAQFAEIVKRVTRLTSALEAR